MLSSLTSGMGLALTPLVLAQYYAAGPVAYSASQHDNGGSSASLPLDLSGLLNSKAFGKEPGEVNFDSVGGSFPAVFMPPANLTLGGIHFHFPQYGNATSFDNLLATGQSVSFPKGRYVSVHMLAAAENDTIAVGDITATYEGNRSSSGSVLVDPYWTWPYPYGGDIIFPYRLTNESIDYNRSNIFHTSNWLDSTTDMETLQLPNITFGAGTGPGGAAENTRLHIFAVTLVPAGREGFSLEIGSARSTQLWMEGTNKTQIFEAIVTNVGSEWVTSNNTMEVSISAPNLTTVRPAVIKRLRPGDQAIVQIGVTNNEGTPPGTFGDAECIVSGQDFNASYSFNGTYGISEYLPSYHSIYTHESPTWYNDAKFGIFIHWGIYSVPGWGNKGKNETYAEWYWWDMNLGPDFPPDTYQYNLDTYGPNHTYDNFIPDFTAADWDPKMWVDLFANAGAKYFVQVTKHHDGFALFDLPPEVSDRTAVKLGPHRNLLQELFDAAEQYQPDLHKATYYSLPEWFNPAYLPFGFGSWPGGNATNPYTNVTLPYTGFVDVEDYVSDIILPSMQTLAGMGTEIMWCDIGGPNLTAEFAAEFFNDAAMEGRQVVMNSRCGLPGDFDTPEYARYSALPPRKWESNLGMDPFSFGFNRDTPTSAYMTPYTLISSLVDIVSKNGNFLLDIGPMANGTIVQVEIDNLQTAGVWIRNHGEAIYGTKYWYVAAQEGENYRFTQTDCAFYILSLFRPNGTIMLDSPVPYLDGDNITVVGGNMSGTAVPSELMANGSLEITVPEEVSEADEYCWVFKITF